VRSTPRPPLLLSALLLALAGCAAPPPAPLVEPQDLPAREGARVRLRTDLPDAEAKDALAECDAIEDALDAAVPFLPAPSALPLVIAVADPARHALLAKEHGVDRPAGAYVVGADMVVVRWEPEAPPMVGRDDEPVALEPPLRPLAAASLRRRLLAGLGPLPPTWLEDALAEVFVEAALGVDPSRGAAARRRERLLDAYLPLYLGAPPAVVTVCSPRATKSDPRRRSEAGVNPALAAAVVRFCLLDPDRAKLLRRSLERAAGLVDDVEWATVTAALAGLDAPFERWLAESVRHALLEQLVLAPWPVDRWEAASALRLLCNVDLDADADDDTRERQADATRELLQKEPPQRFLAGFRGELGKATDARSRLQALSYVQKMVLGELDRRAKGYGHPAIDAARADLGRALQRELDRL